MAVAQTTQVPRTGNGGGREGTACWSTRGGAETRARRVAGGSGRGGAGDQVGWSHRERARGPASAARVVAEARRRQRGAGRPGTVGPRGCWSTRAGGRPPPRDRGDSWSTGSTRREGGKEAQGRARARALRPRGPLWEGGSARPPPATSKRLSGRGPPALPPFPVPARGERPGGEGGGQRAGRPDAPGAERRGERTPPTLRLAGKRARERKDGATDADGMGWDGMGRLRRAPNPPAPPRPAPLRPGPVSRRGRGGGTPGGRREEEDRTGQDRTGPDKPLCRGLTFNRSQRGSCSATYETPTQKQVVYEWFSTRFPTNVRCVTGEGAAPFPAAPRFPGRGALRTGPRSRRAAGHAAPRGARAAARRRGRRGTGYPRPTEAPRRCRIVPPGRDSDLEAFSHNPTDGSFAPLAPQPSTYTKCLNLRFLSY